MNTPARISIAAAAVLGTVGLLILMTLYPWVALSVCALAVLGLGYAVYDFLTLRTKD